MHQGLLILLFLPLVVSFLLIFRFSKQKIVEHLVISSSTLIFFLLLVSYSFVDSKSPVEITLYRWITMGEFNVAFSLIIDNLAWWMLLFISAISMLVQIYALAYMKSSIQDQISYRRFFSYINFFIFSMFILVCANDLILFFISWELIAISSYLLIGFNRLDKNANQANILTFVVGRLGDLLMLIGFCILIITFGETKINLIVSEATNIKSINLGSIPVLYLSVGFITGGLISKSAQLPLFFWLPKAMVAHLPVSALIHSATLVSAGIFMVIRLLPLFNQVPEIFLFLLILGAITALITAIIAAASKDIKELLAFSTCSHLGLILVILATKTELSAITELVSHGFYKVLLFMSVGIFLLYGYQLNTNNVDKKNKPIKIYNWMLIIGIYSMLPLPYSLSNLAVIEISNYLLNLKQFSGKLLYVLINFTILFTAIYAGRILYLLNQNYLSNSDKNFQQNLIDFRFYMPIGLLAISSILFGLYKSFANFKAEVILSISSQSFWMVLIGLTIAWLIFFRYPKTKNKFLANPVFYFFYRIFAKNLFIDQIISLIKINVNKIALRLYKLIEKFIYVQLAGVLIGHLKIGTKKMEQIEKVGIGQMTINVIIFALLFIALFITID